MPIHGNPTISVQHKPNTTCNPQSYCNPGAIPTSICNRDLTHSVYICDHSRAVHHTAHGSTLYRPEYSLAIPVIPSHLLANASFRSPNANQILTQCNTIPNPRAIPTQSKNPTATQAEDLAEGYKELEIGLRCISNP